MGNNQIKVENGQVMTMVSFLLFSLEQGKSEKRNLGLFMKQELPLLPSLSKDNLSLLIKEMFFLQMNGVGQWNRNW